MRAMGGAVKPPPRCEVVSVDVGAVEIERIAGRDADRSRAISGKGAPAYPR